MGKAQIQDSREHFRDLEFYIYTHDYIPHCISDGMYTGVPLLIIPFPFPSHKWCLSTMFIIVFISFINISGILSTMLTIVFRFQILVLVSR